MAEPIRVNTTQVGEDADQLLAEVREYLTVQCGTDGENVWNAWFSNRVCGYSQNEIARQMGVSRGTVGNLINRAKEVLNAAY
jgi:hypothetical protein